MKALYVLPLAALAAACSLKPHAVERSNFGRLAVAFDANALPPELAAQMKSLQVRVYKSENGARVGQPELELSLPISAGQDKYLIKGVTIGLKEVEVAILNADGDALGTGVLKSVLVQPGHNDLPPLTIEIQGLASAKTTVTVDLGVTAEGVKKVVFQWQTKNAAQSGELELLRPAPANPDAVTYAAIKPVLQENCISCHKSATTGSKLKLDVFPFKSAKIADEAQLMASVMERIQTTDEDRQMPQDGLMPADQIALFKSWQAGGFLASLPVADGRYKGALPALKVADLLFGTLVFTGENGVILGKKEVQPASIVADQVLKLDETLVIAAPEVSVPIVVVPHQ